MKNKLNNQKAITLIALVITIIILLILASISIAMLTGENGILSKANKASEEYKRNAAEEKIKIAIMSYQVNKEETTLYAELLAIEGLTSISPSDTSGPSYTVIVDGYEFEIKEDLSIEYKGEKDEPNQYMPEIIEINYEKIQKLEKIPIIIKAKTEDETGLKEISISYKKEEDGQTKYYNITSKEVTGKEATIEGEISFNGTYIIQVIGKNGKIKREEIEVSNIEEGGILATVTVGNLLENNEPKANLIINGEGEGIAIKEVQLYVAGKNVETYKYEDLQSKRKETYKLENLEFYKNTECYVKVIGINKEMASEPVSLMNDRIIKTKADLRNLATEVNNGRTFENKTIQLIENIETGDNWIPIGYWNGIEADWEGGRYFSGTFEGNDHNITITSLTKDEKYKSSGLFGTGIGCTINKLTVEGRLDANMTMMGGIIGSIKDGRIVNCTNNCEITDTTKNWHGGITAQSYNSQIDNCINNGNIYGNSVVGGICGYLCNNSTLSNCTNSGIIKCYGTSEIKNGTAEGMAGVVGGICAKNERSLIQYSTNLGEITGNVSTTDSNKIVAGGIAGWCDYATVSTSKNKGTIHYDIATGHAEFSAVGGITGYAIVSTIEQSFNIGTVTGKYNDNYGASLVGGVVGYMNASTIKNNYNTGSIYGSTGVGGVIGHATVEAGVQGKSCIYNSYNSSKNIGGNPNEISVGSFLGHVDSTEGAYFACLGNGGDFQPNCSWGETAPYNTIEEMKGKDSKLLKLILKGNGETFWAQDDNINDGLPYLVNNIP